MKNRRFVFVMLLMLAMTSGAEEKKVYPVRHSGGVNVPIPKSPELPLTIDITDHTLTLFDPFVESVSVELLDENENVVYTDWLAPGQTTLTFPNTLSGEYTIRLTVGSIYYIGVIELE